MNLHAEEAVDVVVAGGGPAGLQAALMLGRSRRAVIVADGGQPRNSPATAVHNLLGHEGVAPDVWLAAARADVERYGVRFHQTDVVAGNRDGSDIVVRFADGTECRARALVLATGLVEDLPPVDGLAAHWGRAVVACPYCHGWEATGQAVAVLGSGARAWQQLLLLRRFTDDLVLVANGSTGFDDTQLDYLRRTGIPVIEDPVAQVLGEDDKLTGVEFASGDVLARDAVFVVTRRRLRSDLAERLGCAVDEGPAVVTGPDGKTSVPGVWAAGSVANPSLTVTGAAGHASAVAIAINNSLIDEDVQRVLREDPLE